jgi:hypothetical protein
MQAATPESGRLGLLKGADVWVETAGDPRNVVGMCLAGIVRRSGLPSTAIDQSISI